VTISLTPEEDAQSALARFDEYKTALLAANGDVAVSYVDAETIDYYEQMRSMALRAPRQEVEAMGMMDRFMVLLLRHRMTPGELEGMSGTSLFIYAVENGWISQDSIGRIKLGTATPVADTIRVPVVSTGQATQMKVLFHRQSGEWKINLPSFTAIAEPALKIVAERMNYEEDELLFWLLQQATGKRSTEALWDPMTP